jgi:hypothetical protein
MASGYFGIMFTKPVPFFSGKSNSMCEATFWN